MYTPRYGMNYVAQQTVAARLGGAYRAKTNEEPSRVGSVDRFSDEEAGALWRMLTVVAVVVVVAVGTVLAFSVWGL